MEICRVVVSAHRRAIRSSQGEEARLAAREYAQQGHDQLPLKTRGIKTKKSRNKNRKPPGSQATMYLRGDESPCTYRYLVICE